MSRNTKACQKAPEAGDQRGEASSPELQEEPRSDTSISDFLPPGLRGSASAAPSHAVCDAVLQQAWELSPLHHPYLWRLIASGTVLDSTGMEHFCLADRSIGQCSPACIL